MPFSPRLACAPEPGCPRDATAAKAARRAAKEAARAAAEAQDVVDAAEEGPEEAAAAKAARKAARRAARAAAEARDAADAAAEPEAPRSAAAGAGGGSAPGAAGAEKRRAGPGGAAGPAAAKRRKPAAEEGAAGAGKGLGPAAFRQLHEILVNASCPAPFETFVAAAPALGPALSAALAAQGYAAPSPIQAQSWPIALAGEDIVAVAKTGSGKTCGFLVPALARIAERGPAPAPKRLSYWSSEPARPSVLVVAPTRELALQIAGEAEKFAPAARARVVVLYGGAPKGPQVGAFREGADILIATPGRLNDLCQGDATRGLDPSVSLEAVTYLVLDEADQMLDMGFEPAIRQIVARCPATGKPQEGGGASGKLAGTKRQTLFFTATWPKKVQAVAASFTSKAAVQVRIGQGTGGDKLTLNKNVAQEVCMCEYKEKARKLTAFLKQRFGQNESAVIFAATKGTCDFLERRVGEEFPQLWCRALHGDKEQWEREEMLGQFRTKVAGGQQAVLVATDVAARGLDIPGIALVVIYDFSHARQPADVAVESFVHRVGRTGRAGKTGRAFTLWTSEDKGAPQLAKLLEEAGQRVPSEFKEAAAWERPAGKGRKNHGWGKSWW